MIHARIALHAVEVDIKAESGITALFGAGGDGKTTILDAIAGFVTPRSGRIILDDQILFDAAARVNLPPRRRHCGYVSRHWALFPHMSLRDNLLFPLAHLPRLERHRLVTETVERFQLHDALDRRPQDVARADQLRCTVARALIGEPKALLVDEPSGGLDASLRAEWLRVFRMIRDEANLPVLLASRDLDLCFELATTLVLLDGGRILQQGPPRAVIAQPASLSAARLLGIRNLLAATITGLDPGRDTSRLRLDGFELNGPYFPGHLRGDRVWVFADTRDLRPAPADGSKPPANHIIARLQRASSSAHAVRLEFENGIVAEVSPSEFDRQKDNKDWVVEFPPQALQVIARDAEDL